jgi:hypothetical protein
VFFELPLVNTTLKSLIIAVGAAFFSVPAGFAQLATQTATFTGVMPTGCTQSGFIDASVTMTPSGLAQLTGTTGIFNYEANAAVDLVLNPVTIISAPSGTTSYIWQASLLDGTNTQLISVLATSSTPAERAFNSGITSNVAFRLLMQVGPSSGNMKPGTYSGSVTLDCVAQ